MAIQTVDFSTIDTVTKDGLSLTEVVIDGVSIWNSAYLGLLWQKIGTDIDGINLEDESGYSVAINSAGTRVAIGCPRGDATSITNPIYTRPAGMVRVFDWTGAFWSEMGGSPFNMVDSVSWQGQNSGTNVGATGKTEINFGLSVAMNDLGTVLLIGTSMTSDHGSFFKFVWNGSSWVFTAEYSSSNLFTTQFGNEVGKTVRISGDGTTALLINGGGDRVAWTAPTANMTNTSSPSAKVSGEKLIATEQYEGDINADGTVVIVANPVAIKNGFSQAGEVRVYENATTTPSQKGAFFTGQSVSALAGKSCSIDATGNRVAFSEGITIKAYDYNSGTTAWDQAGAAIVITGMKHFKMSSDGNTIIASVVIAPSTHHYITYRWSGSAWGSLAIPVPAETYGDGFGQQIDSLCITPDGSKCIVGSHLNGGGGNNSGSSRVYDLI